MPKKMAADASRTPSIGGRRLRLGSLAFFIPLGLILYSLVTTKEDNACYPFGPRVECGALPWSTDTNAGQSCTFFLLVLPAPRCLAENPPFIHAKIDRNTATDVQAFLALVGTHASQRVAAGFLKVKGPRASGSPAASIPTKGQAPTPSPPPKGLVIPNSASVPSFHSRTTAKPSWSAEANHVLQHAAMTAAPD